MNEDKIRGALKAAVECFTVEIWDGDLSNYQAVLAAHRICKEALAALDDDGWVKCSERLPKLRGKTKRRKNFGLPVLIYPPDGDYHQAYWGKRCSDKPAFYLFDRVLTHVTHWRELPPPPEEDDG